MATLLVHLDCLVSSEVYSPTLINHSLLHEIDRKKMISVLLLPTESTTEQYWQGPLSLEKYFNYHIVADEGSFVSLDRYVHFLESARIHLVNLFSAPLIYLDTNDKRLLAAREADLPSIFYNQELSLFNFRRGRYDQRS